MSALVYVPAAALLGFVAFATFHQAETDFRYQLAGTADPFLGHPAPLLSVILGVALSLVVLAVVTVIRHTRQPVSSGRPVVRWRTEWLLVAGWTGYVAGAGVVIAAGGPFVTSGTLRYELGPPLDSVAVVNATCTSIVGDRATIAQVIPNVDGVLGLELRFVATGAGGPSFLPARRGFPGGTLKEPLPVPDRPAIYESMVDENGTVVERSRLAFADAYTYQRGRVEETGRSGMMELLATRRPFTDESRYLHYENAVVPNDPWPSRFTLVLRWSCAAAGPSGPASPS